MMHTGRRAAIQGGEFALAAGLAPGRSGAQGAPVLRLGVLTNLSGPYRDTGSSGSVECTRQAAQDARTSLPGLAVEVAAGDHQNKVDAGVALARQSLSEATADQSSPHAGGWSNSRCGCTLWRRGWTGLRAAGDRLEAIGWP